VGILRYNEAAPLLCQSIASTIPNVTRANLAEIDWIRKAFLSVASASLLALANRLSRHAHWPALIPHLFTSGHCLAQTSRVKHRETGGIMTLEWQVLAVALVAIFLRLVVMSKDLNAIEADGQQPLRDRNSGSSRL
jgi:hypothetical protein